MHGEIFSSAPIFLSSVFLALKLESVWKRTFLVFFYQRRFNAFSLFLPAFCSVSNPNSLRRMSVNMSAKGNVEMAVMNKRLDVLARKEARIQVRKLFWRHRRVISKLRSLCVNTKNQRKQAISWNFTTKSIKSQIHPANSKKPSK